jgi:hypothetical protein
LALVRSVVSVALMFGGAGRATAAYNFMVSSSADDYSTGTLRDVITHHANYYFPSTIQFDPSLTGQTITLLHGQIPVTAATTIQGPGASKLTISGNNTDRVFQIFSNAVTPPNVTISGLTLTAGTSSGGGGAIYAKDIALSLQNVTVTNSSASLGAGIYAKTGSCSLTSTTLQNNVATTLGGAMYVTGATSVQISSSTLSGNHVTTGSGGAALFLHVPSVTLTTSSVTNNHARTNAGGIAADYSPLQVTYSTLSGNYAGAAYHGYGGAIWVHDANLTLTRATLTGNGANSTYRGGAIYFRDGRATPTAALNVTRSTISGNTAFLGGGGIYVERAGSVAIGYSALNLNRAGGAATFGGGALFMRSVASGAQVHDTTIYGNYAHGYGGGIDLYSKAIADGTTLTSVTLVGNSTHAYQSNGIRAYSSGPTPGVPTLDSCIVANNSNSTSSQDLTGTFNVHFSLVKTPGTGAGAATFSAGSANNIVGTDPALGPLRAYGGPTLSMLPNLGSPVIDAGDNSVTQTKDQRGLARKVGGKVDIGAVERQNPEDVIFQDGFEGP